MAKVITYSRQYPSYHTRKGEPTFFVERIWASLGSSYFDQLADEDRIFNPRLSLNTFEPKFTTILEGHRFKAGDWFSPRVWSGKPYRSQQIIIAPDIQIKKVWDFVIDCDYFLNQKIVLIDKLKLIALNDGFSDLDDFELWFDLKVHEVFDGQIICWNEKIEY